MVILQAGVPKSGNVWLHRILQLTLDHGGVPRRSYIQAHPIQAQARTWELSYQGHADVDNLDILPAGCVCRISAVFREPVTDLDAYLRRCRHVWTHSTINARSPAVLPKFDRIVYIIRDPRDVAISMANYVFTPHVQRRFPPHYEKSPTTFLQHALDGLLRDWVQHVGGWLRYQDGPPVHVVFYERLRQSFDAELTALADYLGVRLDVAARAAIRTATDFAAMKPGSPNHLRQGLAGGWRQVCTGPQNRLATQIAGPLLRLLNYPVHPTDPETLPARPASLPPAALAAALAAARRSLGDEVRRVWDFAVSDRPLRAKLNRVRDWTRQRP